MTQKLKISRRRFSAALAPAMLLIGSWGRADENKKQQREKLLSQMRSLAEKTSVRFAEGDRQPELLKDPVFRYDDQPRRFIDATVWVWTDEGRPVAFQKIEAVEYGDRDSPSSLWQYCFTSVSPDLLRSQWRENRRFRAAKPGVDFRPLAEAPPVAEGNTQRKRQARELAGKFSARILSDRRDNVHQQMRLLTTPIFEYADPQTKEFQGAVFGFSTNGTNPDVLVVLEVRAEKRTVAWHYAPARMTCGAVNLAFQDSEVWQVDWVEPGQAPFPTWTFFSTPRTPVPGEETP